MFSTPQSFYQQKYFALIDAAIGALDSRSACESDTWNFFGRRRTCFNYHACRHIVISSFVDAEVDSERLKIHVSMSHDLLRQKLETAATSWQYR